MSNLQKILPLLAAFVLLLPLSARAETKEERANWHHELRIGWGDQLFETLIWHKPASVITSMPTDYTATYNEDFHYSQHIFAEYQYRFNHWFGFGFMLDNSSVRWSEMTRNGAGEVLDTDPHHYFYNIVAMPTLRFTYMHKPYVNLYSGLGAGICVNGGSEKDAKGYTTVVAPAMNFTILGLSADYKHACFAIEYGGLYALRNSNTIFLCKSRMFTASIGVRF